MLLSQTAKGAARCVVALLESLPMGALVLWLGSLSCVSSLQVTDTPTEGKEQVDDETSGDGGSDPSDGGTVDPGDDNGPFYSNLDAVIHDAFGSIVVVSWMQEKPAVGWIEFSFDADVWLSSPKRQRAAGSSDELLLGVPYETDVVFRLVLDSGNGPRVGGSQQIKTKSLPSGAWRTWKVRHMQDGAFDSTVPYFLVSLYNDSGPHGTAIIDRHARYVWLRPTKESRCTLQAQPSSNGSDFLVDESSFWTEFDEGARSQVVRMKIDGTKLATYDTPGLHHPFTEAPDGSILWAANDGDNETVERLLPSGKQETLFSCDQIMRKLDGEDYCAANTVHWNPSTNSFLYSLYSHETVLEIDASDGTVLRIFGHQDDAYAFSPANKGFWWQHGGHYTESGTFLVSSYVASGDDELVVREYRVNDDTRTLELVWSFGDSLGVHGYEMGEVHRLPDGNILHNYGGNPRLREVTHGGEVVWDVALQGSSDGWEVGRSAPLADLYDFAP